MSSVTTSGEDTTGAAGDEIVAATLEVVLEPASGIGPSSALWSAPATSQVELREISGHTTVVALIGEHDLASRHRLREEFERARLAATVIVDLTGCTFLDSTVIESLVTAQKRMHVELAMPAVGSIADRALHITGLPQFFTTHGSLEQALDSTNPRRAHL